MKRLVLMVMFAGALVLAPGAWAATITVNDDPDAAANDGDCTLREAIIAANTDTVSGEMLGECAAGSGADMIAFDATFNPSVSVGDSTIDGSGTSLPAITQPVTIAGGNCGSPKPCAGFDANSPTATAFSVDAANVTISGIAIFDGNVAIDGSTDPGLVVRNTWLGMQLNGVAAGNTHGIIVRGDNAVIGGTGASDRNVIAKTVNSAVRIVGASNVTVQGNYIGTRADGLAAASPAGGNLHGVQVVGDSSIPTPTPLGTLIGGPEAGVPGTCEAPCNVIATNSSSAIDLKGSGTDTPAGQTAIEGNFVGLSAAGADLTGSDAIAVGDADDVTVGGDASRRNYVTTEISATAGAANLDVVANFVGLNPAGTARVDDDATLAIGALGSPIVGANVTGNRIATAGGVFAINLAATSSVVQGNVVGIGTGGVNVGGGSTGIYVDGGSANQIGGSGPGEGNVIGNADIGIFLDDSNGNTVAGNVIGTDATEMQSHPILSTDGIFVFGDNNVIGGTTAASENVLVNIASRDAIRLHGDGTDFNRILRNRGSAPVGQEFVELFPAEGPGNDDLGPNEGIERPFIIAGATSQQVSGGGAEPGAIVRVYRTASAAGAGPRDVLAYVGQATASPGGSWTLICPSAGCEVGLPGAGQVTANQTSTTGNSSEMAAPKDYTDLAPDTTITSGPAAGSTTGDSTPTFGFSSSEPSSTFECRIDGAVFGACIGPGGTHTPAALADGPHTFEVKATDSTANPDPTAASRSFTVDATPPDTQIDSGPPAGTTIADSTPSFGFSATEPGSTFECRLDGAAFAACSGPGATHTPDALADGQHTFEVRGTDAVGNTDASAASRAFTVDTTSPDTQIDTGPAAGSATGDSTPSFGFSATEVGSTFECRIDAAAFAACGGPGATHTPAALADGQHTFEVRATDAVGNVDASAASRGFTVDTTAPDTQVDSGPAAGSTTGDSTPSFGFSATEAGSTFECRIDAAAFAGCSGPGAAHTTAALADGQHTFEVRGTDAVGNVDATPATRVFTVDATGPDTQIASGPAADAVTRDRTPTFGFSATEPGSTFQCRIDGGAFTTCSGPGAVHTPAALGNGRHRLEVRARDAVGNVDATPATRAFTVDADPPETTITKRPRKNTANRVARFRFRSNEAGSTFQCKLDKGRFKRCSSRFRKKVKPGKHVLRVRAIDRAGNADRTPATAKWTVRR